MKKNILFLTLLLMSLVMKAQTRNITIDWSKHAPKSTNSEIKKTASSSPSQSDRAEASLRLEISEDVLAYYEQWENDGFVDTKSLRVNNIKYGALTPKELKEINKNLVPNAPEYSIQNSKSRDVLYTLFQITPIIKINESYKKIISFSISYGKTNFSSGQSRREITNSVLASGSWYKFKIDKTGVYRINKDFLNDLGMNTDGINPRSLKVYGHGGTPLPLRNTLNTQFDLPQIAIQVIGEEDGSFDGGDAILFYGIGVGGYDETEDVFSEGSSRKLNDTNLNPYSDEAYYYVTVDGEPGIRVQPMSEPTAIGIPITQFHDYQFHEEDDFSPGLVGRRWFGNRFDIESEQSFEFDFPNLVTTGDPMHVVIKAASSSESITSMAVSINGTSVDPLVFSALGGETVVNTSQYQGDVPATGTSVVVDMAYNNGGNPSSIGYLDYIGVEALRQLIGVDGQLSFKYNDAALLSGTGEYQIGNASQFSQVWDVTNPQFVLAKQNDDGADVFSFKASLGEIRKYVAVNPNDYFAPIQTAQSYVPNQNLKGTIFNDESGNFEDIDYLIVTAPFLIQPALRLANHHKNVTGLRVKVVTTDKIYTEFSSGQQDISAIRNFVRYIYENASSQDQRIQYLCLFGDTSVDYKNRLSGNNNIVPTHHTLFSNSIHTSYMSDDFFGMMDATPQVDEGTMGGSDKLDIAVGRILADQVGLANDMVNKIIDYSSKASYGNWRNNFILISDDVDEGDTFLEVNLDELGDDISREKPFVNVKKIHSDAYQQETSAGGNRYPEVNEAIKNNIELGALIINYFGHGGEDGMASEFIYTKNIAQDLKNRHRYPLLVTLTCELTKFDNPLRITAGELTYWNKEGGAIALLTTTRAISASTGSNFNIRLAKHLFGFETNSPKNPAEALRLAKNEIGGTGERRVVFFIGDPGMPLAFPKKEIRLTKLNGVPISQSVDTLKALSKVRIEGEVVDETGVLLANYNGVLEAKVFDKNIERQTLANDQGAGGFILDFITLGEGLFNGKATVTGGTFDFEFVMPKDTQIPVGNGRVSFYAQRNGVLEDQTGVNLDVLVGGLNENAPADDIGPRINLFMNDESFSSGGITNDSPVLIAKLEDANGMNTASGIGHDMIAILDGDESNPFVVNEYYQADVDDFTKGTLNYKLRDLEDGLHTITLKAWDVYNNSSTEEIQFIVAGGDALEITRVLNYPNPFVNYTQFWFSHNRENEEFLDVQVQIFTVTGKVVKTIGGTYPTGGINLFREIEWDGLDDFGDKIGKGVYVYKIIVKSPLTNKRVEKFEKLVIL